MNIRGQSRLPNQHLNKTSVAHTFAESVIKLLYERKIYRVFRHRLQTGSDYFFTLRLIPLIIEIKTISGAVNATRLMEIL